AIYIFMFFYNQTDTKNVYLQGHVYNKQQVALQGAKIKIINYRYTSDSGHQNYDEYLGEDIINLESDKTGSFSAHFPLSAYIGMEIQKTGYKSEEKWIRDIRKKISVEIILDEE